MIGSQTVTVHRAGGSGTDRYGDPVVDPETGTQQVLRGCLVVPRTTAELGGTARAGVVVGLTLYAPGVLELEHDDRVEYDGEMFEVDGEPGAWRTLHGRPRVTEIALRRTEG